jgi:hypothetical protein
VEGLDHGTCPVCGLQSISRHSSYRWTLQDLSAQGKPVSVRARLTRWRCRNDRCERRIFAERLPELTAPFDLPASPTRGLSRSRSAACMKRKLAIFYLVSWRLAMIRRVTDSICWAKQWFHRRGAASRSCDNSAVTIVLLKLPPWQQTRSFFDRCLNRCDVATANRRPYQVQRASRRRNPTPFRARR